MYKFIIWESSLFLIAALISDKTRISEYIGKLPSIIIFKLFLASFISQIMVLLYIDNDFIYLITILLLTALALIVRVPSVIHKYHNNCPKESEYIFLALLIVFIFFPIICYSIGHILEQDSRHYIYSLIQMSKGLKSIYETPIEYNFYWEMAYIPSLILTKSLSYTWLTSLQAVLLEALLVFSISIHIIKDRKLSFLIAILSIAMYHQFRIPSGIVSIKNDMIYACGILLYINIILRGRMNLKFSSLALIIGIASSFIIVKYSGILVLIITSILYLIRTAWIDKINVRNTTILFCWVALISILAGGHYYIKNILLYGNIFYPMKIKLAWIELPGILFLDGTSLLDAFKAGKGWKEFLIGTDHINIGYLFPILLFVFICSLSKLKTLYNEKSSIALVILFTLTIWLIFIVSYWSASNTPIDLFYIMYQSNFRYITAGIALIYILANWFLIQIIRIPKQILYGIAFLGITNNYLLLLMDKIRFTTFTHILLLYICGALLISGFLLCYFIRRASANNSHLKYFMLLLFEITILLFQPYIEVYNIVFWKINYRNIIAQIAYAQPANIFLLNKYKNNNIQQSLYYPYIGYNFQHNVKMGSDIDMTNWLQKSNQLQDSYVIVHNCHDAQINCNDFLKIYNDILAKHKFAKINSDQESLIYKKSRIDF